MQESRHPQSKGCDRLQAEAEVRVTCRERGWRVQPQPRHVRPWPWQGVPWWLWLRWYAFCQSMLKLIAIYKFLTTTQSKFYIYTWIWDFKWENYCYIWFFINPIKSKRKNQWKLYPRLLTWTPNAGSNPGLYFTKCVYALWGWRIKYCVLFVCGTL